MLTVSLTVVAATKDKNEARWGNTRIGVRYFSTVNVVYMEKKTREGKSRRMRKEMLGRV